MTGDQPVDPLRQRRKALNPSVDGQEPAAATPEDQLRDDLLSALLNLGYQRAVAEKAVDRGLKGTSKGSVTAGFEEALRDVLRGLMKG